MLIVLFIPSSYSLDAKASRGRARVFYALTKKREPPVGVTDRENNRYPNNKIRIAYVSFLVILKDLLGKE